MERLLLLLLLLLPLLEAGPHLQEVQETGRDILHLLQQKRSPEEPSFTSLLLDILVKGANNVLTLQ